MHLRSTLMRLHRRQWLFAHSTAAATQSPTRVRIHMPSASSVSPVDFRHMYTLAAGHLLAQVSRVCAASWLPASGMRVQRFGGKCVAATQQSCATIQTGGMSSVLDGLSGSVICVSIADGTVHGR